MVLDCVSIRTHDTPAPVPGQNNYGSGSMLASLFDRLWLYS